MTAEESKVLFDFWSIKPRGVDGKRARPGDAVPVLTNEEIARLMTLPPADRKTEVALIAAQQAAQAKGAGSV